MTDKTVQAMPELPEPKGWLMTFTHDVTGASRRFCEHNSVADYRSTWPDATSEPVYTQAQLEAYAAQRTAELEAARAHELELLDILKGVHTVLQIALAAKDGRQHANLETMAGSFICMTPTMRQLEAVLTNTKEQSK